MGYFVFILRDRGARARGVCVIGRPSGAELGLLLLRD